MKMKKLLAGILALSMAAAMAAASASYAEELTGMVIYVSPEGNDSNDGSEGSPLATMKGAQEKIRQIKASGMPENGITVAFREGSYLWTDTLTFTAEDSGTEQGKIVYRSYPGEKAVMEAGIRIPGTEFTPVTNEDILIKWSSAKAKQNIRQIDIKSYMAKNGYNNIADYYTQMYDVYQFNGTYQGTAAEAEEGRTTAIRRPLYSFDGEQALWLARYPNKEGGWYPDTHPLTQFIKTGEVTKDGGSTEPTTFKYSERRISKYEGYEDVYIFGHLYYLFYHDEAKVTINATDQTITTVAPLPLGAKSGMDFIIFNILDELDAPGEYYIDKNTGMMYVYPNGDISEKTLNVTLLDKNWMIEMEDASNITFSGLTFENSKGGGVFVKSGDNVRFEYCDFNNFGTQGVKIGDTDGLVYSEFGSLEWAEFDRVDGKDWYEEQYDYWKDQKMIKSKNNGLYGCIINNTGNSGVALAGGSAHTDDRCNYYVENCIIENSSLYKRTYGASISVRGHGLIINNNRMGHTPASVINGNLTLAEFDGNELYDSMSESNDNGVIYLNYQYPNLDVKFTNNYFHDTNPEHEIKSSTSTFSQRSGVAFDNSYGGGIVYDNNVFVNIPRGIFMKTNNIVNNNVFVDCFTPIQLSDGVTNTQVTIPETISKETISGLHDYVKFFLSWPIFSNTDYGQTVTNEWTQKYPTVMEWVNNVKSGANEGKDYYEAKNNLIVNNSVPLHQAVTKLGTVETYQASTRHEVANNVYTDDTSMFVDYANRNYQLTSDASAQYGNTLNLSTAGPKIDMVGSDKFAAANVALPNVSGGAAAPSAAMPEKVKDAVILTTHSPNAYANGNIVKIDSRNSSVMPKIIDDRTLVPARFISESFGGEVGWDADTRTVTITIDSKTAKLVIDNKDLMIDDVKVTEMDVPAQIIEDRTMVPLRVLCETVLGKKVFWDNKGLIVISDNENILDSSADAAVIDEILSILD